MEPKNDRCDKVRCQNLATGFVACDVCGKVYSRCPNHDGEKGARRSCTSHKGLYHSVEKGA